MACPRPAMNCRFLRAAIPSANSCWLVRAACISKKRAALARSLSCRRVAADNSIYSSCPGEFMRCTWLSLLAAAAVSSLSAPSVRAQPGDWPLYRHDTSGTGYSPLAQITVQNVGGLAQAWSFRLQSDTPTALQSGPRRGPGGPNSEATPIVVNGVMYLPTADRVVGLEPESGKKIWEDAVSGGTPSRRGVAYWAGDK